MKRTILFLTLLCGAAAPHEEAAPRRATSTVQVPADLPLDAHGIPLRPLDDAELYRLLLALSATNQPAVLLLARCHARGSAYGTEGWRACIVQP